ncbi:unnamed protein product [Caenorhabditis nigoni]
MSNSQITHVIKKYIPEKLMNCVKLPSDYEEKELNAEEMKTVPDSQLMPYGIREDDESEVSILARVKKMYPMNTFNVVHDSPLDEKCKARRLWCNVKMMYSAYDYISLIQRYKLQPKFQC